MVLSRFLSSQLSNPSGLVGRCLTTRFFNYANRDLIHRALENLQLGPHDHYLDVGCGGGASIRTAAAQITTGHMYGVDPSVAALRGTARLLADLVQTGRLTLQPGAAEALPIEDGRIDKLSAIHTVCFWHDISAGIGECFRVLKPNGLLIIALSFQPGQDQEPPEIQPELWGPDPLALCLSKVGFTGLNIAALRNLRTKRDYLIIGRKPATAASLNAQAALL